MGVAITAIKHKVATHITQLTLNLKPLVGCLATGVEGSPPGVRGGRGVTGVRGVSGGWEDCGMAGGV